MLFRMLERRLVRMLGVGKLLSGCSEETPGADPPRTGGHHYRGKLNEIAGRWKDSQRSRPR